MPQEGLSMRKVREILRLRLGVGLSSRQVARSCKVRSSTVLEYEKRAREAGLSWPLPDDLDDSVLEHLVRARLVVTKQDRPLPEISYLVQEMKRPHVTLSLLWLEYKAANPDGYQYTQFCRYYNSEKKKLDVVLRQEHMAGEKLFTDYAGDTVGITKCAVIKPDRYEPDLNPAFAGMAAHYSTAVIPTRVARPRDKAPVEAGVLLVERWVLAALRNRTFFSVREPNQAIAGLLERLNNRKFKKMNSTRRELFENLEWKTAKVGIDYYIVADKHFYSVPYQLTGEQVDVRLSQTTVEILYKNRRVASHIRSFVEGGYTTCRDHRPKSHQAHLEWPPSRIVSWAQKTGPATAALVEMIMRSRPHPEMGYRSCLGIIRLSKQYGAQRVETAALRALSANVTSYKSLKSILDRGLDKVLMKDEKLPALSLASHANVRGRDYYK